MRGVVVVSNFFTNLFSAKRAAAVAIFPFIFLAKKSYKNNLILLNHERIHLSQALELGVLFFYLWYIIEFFVHYIQCRNFNKAYLRISFEREAYHNESNPHYLKQRKFYSFLRYY